MNQFLVIVFIEPFCHNKNKMNSTSQPKKNANNNNIPMILWLEVQKLDIAYKQKG